MNTSSSAPVKEERLGLGLYPVGVGGGGWRCSSNFFGFEFGQILFFFLGGVSKTGAFLGYVKLWPQEHFFHPLLEINSSEINN